MSADPIEDTILDLLRQRVSPDVPLSPLSDLVADVDLDSVALLEVIADLEERTGIRLGEEALQDTVTVRDLARLFTAPSATQ